MSRRAPRIGRPRHRIMLNGSHRISGLEGVAGPAVTGPAHSERDAAYRTGAFYARDYRNHAPVGAQAS
jgi:hypothetical protein